MPLMLLCRLKTVPRLIGRKEDIPYLMGGRGKCFSFLEKMLELPRGVGCRVGNGISFRKNSTVSVNPRKKALIPRHSEFRGRAYSEARNGTEWNSAEKISFTKQQQNNLRK
jgi:hypothetical protein